MNEEKYLRERLILANQKEEVVFNDFIKSFGLDKCVEIYHNLQRIINEEFIDFKKFFDFANYDMELSEILFTLLRYQENHVKAFLSNAFNNYKLTLEARPSNYTKTKYYLKFPVGVNKYLDIRTHVFDKGPVDYYSAIQTLDFGDVNLIMSHLPISLIAKFSDNKNIISDLGKTRKLRNYVYHHNMLFSLGKIELKNAIVLVLQNLPTPKLKDIYINKINELRYKGQNRDKDIGSDIAITIDEFDIKEINKY